MEIYNTENTENAYLSYLIFGKSKTGKTSLITTTEKALLLNVEDNLASLAGANVNVADTRTWPKFMEALNWLSGLPEDQMPKWVFIDSLTELGKVLLQLELSVNKDGRKAYGELAIKITDAIRKLKVLPCNIVCLAQQGHIKDENEGSVFFGASMVGNKLEQSLPYMFDAVLATRFIQGEKENWYTLQCKPTTQYENVGIRTSFLSRDGDITEHEQQDLTALNKKIISHSAE